MSDRTLRRLIIESRFLKTDEERAAWVRDLSPGEVEVFTEYVQGLIDQLVSIFKRISEAIQEG